MLAVLICMGHRCFYVLLVERAREYVYKCSYTHWNYVFIFISIYNWDPWGHTSTASYSPTPQDSFDFPPFCLSNSLFQQWEAWPPFPLLTVCSQFPFSFAISSLWECLSQPSLASTPYTMLFPWMDILLSLLGLWQPMPDAPCVASSLIALQCKPLPQTMAAYKRPHPTQFMFQRCTPSCPSVDLFPPSQAPTPWIMLPSMWTPPHPTTPLECWLPIPDGPQPPPPLTLPSVEPQNPFGLWHHHNFSPSLTPPPCFSPLNHSGKTEGKRWTEKEKMPCS